MANLNPVSSFDDVYQIALTDDVLGGAGGAPNAQAQNLLNRTEWLKDNTYTKAETYTQTEINLIESGLQGDIDDNADDIAANLALIVINTGNITTHTSQIAALDGRMDTAEDDITDLEAEQAIQGGKITTLESKGSLTFDNNSAAGITVVAMWGKYDRKTQMVSGKITNTEWGAQWLLVGRILNYQTPGLVTNFAVNPTSDTANSGHGYISSGGYIYVELWRDNTEWVFNFTVIGT